MSSVLLYLAIVVMWLGVLVPMWLRRDRDTIDDIYEEPSASAEADTLIEQKLVMPAEATETAESVDASDSSGSVGSVESGESGESGESVVEEAAPVPPRRAQWRRRARIVARRRRRLLWSVLLFLASVVTAAVGIVSWWAVTPSGLLLAAYVAVLRVAVQVDREQRAAAARARAERLRREREHRRAIEAMAREAEIIQLEARRRVQVFDQYADARRAVGD